MNAENTNWKLRVQDLINTAQSELKKTTAIGMKMLSASQSNTQLKENYEELGSMVVEAIKKGDIQWPNPRVQEIINEVDRLEDELKNLEEDVQNIKRDQAEE
jgi:seryl-tRNA synthetase